jgi:hypothetical protein
MTKPIDPILPSRQVLPFRSAVTDDLIDQMVAAVNEGLPLSRRDVITRETDAPKPFQPETLFQSTEDDQGHRRWVARTGAACGCPVCERFGPWKPEQAEPWPWPVSPDQVRGWLRSVAPDRERGWMRVEFVERLLQEADPAVIEELACALGVFTRRGECNTEYVITSVQQWADRAQ